MSIDHLYQKLSDFAGNLSPAAGALSRCRSGCARCCYTDISVLEVEAENVRRWFRTLRPDARRAKLRAWTAPDARALDFHDRPARACAFLVNDACTIYEARPLICRTQGLPLLFTEGERSFADVCPLNAAMLEEARGSDYLNLDLVTTILVQLEQRDAGGRARRRVELRALREELRGLD
jgi:Fe-S-cluster containining protein